MYRNTNWVRRQGRGRGARPGRSAGPAGCALGALSLFLSQFLDIVREPASQNFFDFFIKLNKNEIKSNKIRQNFQKIKFSKMKFSKIKFVENNI